jgi:hypothetical protein
MFRRSSLARRLRKGPALLLAADPGDRLLDAVRRFDPRAEPGDGFLELTFCLLTGPIEVTPELAAAARLPEDVPIAYLPEHMSPQHAPNTSLVVSGLAHTLGGVRHPPDPDVPGDVWVDPVASVFTVDLTPPDELHKLVAPYLPAAEVTEIPLAEYGIAGPDVVSGAISIECGGLMSYDATMPPPALRDPPARYEYAIFVEHDSLPVAPELLRRAGEVALAIAAGTAGRPLDINGFLISRPEDVHLDGVTGGRPGPLGSPGG